MVESDKETPEWLLERLVAGDLKPEQAQRLQAKLGTAAGLSRVETLQQSNVAILEQHPPAVVATEISRRLAARESRTVRTVGQRFRLTLPLLATAAAAALFAVVVPVDLDKSKPEGETVRLKGLEPHLLIHKKTMDGALLVKDGTAVVPGDLVQVSYVAAGHQFGVIASVDSKRSVTLHLPEAPGLAANLVPQGEVALRHAFELDATAGSERFVFVTSQTPFSTDVVIEALRAGAPLPNQLATSELSLRKNLP